MKRTIVWIAALLALEYAELEREVMVQEKVYEFLTAQFEEARIRESRDLQSVNVLDEAVPPIKKARPRRSLIVLLSAAMAFGVAVTVAFLAHDAARLITGETLYIDGGYHIID